MRYKAFMSYSQAADEKLAAPLQSALHRFAKPWYRLPSIKIFRDKTNLSANPALWSSIKAAIDDSEYFLQFASPEAAAGDWVKRELAHWLESRGTARLLILLTGGEIEWDPVGRDFDWQATTALPDSLRGVFSEEPLYVDLRWARSLESVSSHDPRFRDAVASIGATLHGRSKDELVGEDIRRQRGVKRLVAGTIAILVVLASLATWQAYVATREARRATVQRLAAQSRSVVEDYPQRAVLLAAESMKMATRYEIAEQDALGALASSLTRTSGKTIETAGAPIDAGRFLLETGAHWFGAGPESNAMVAADQAGSAKIWNLSAEDPTADLVGLRSPVTGGESSVLEFSDDGRWLLVGYYSGDAVLWDLKHADGARSHRLPRRHQKGVGHADFSPDGAWLATTGVSTFGDRSPSTLWRLEPGDAFLEAVPLPASGDIPRFTEFSPDGRWLLQASATADDQATEGAKSARPDTLEISSLATGMPPTASLELDVGRWLGLPGSGHSHAFVPGGKWLATIGNEEVLLWDLSGSGVSREPDVRLPTPGRVATIDVSPGGRWLLARLSEFLFSVGEGATLWDLGQPLPTGPALEIPAASLIWTMAFSPDDQSMLLGLDDGTAHFWELGGDAVEDTPIILRGHGGAVMTTAISKNGRWAVTGSTDKTLRLWNLAAYHPERSAKVLRGHDAGLRSVLISNNGRWLGAVDTLETVRLWDLEQPDPSNPTLLFEAGTRIEKALPLEDGDQWVVVEYDDGTGGSGPGSRHEVHFLDSRSKRAFRPSIDLPDLFEYVSAAALSDDRRWLFLGGRGSRKSSSIDVEGALKECQHLESTEEDPELRSAWTDCVMRAMTAPKAPPVNAYLIDLKVAPGSELPLPIAALEKPIEAAAVSPDDRLLAVADEEGAIATWALAEDGVTGSPRLLENDDGAVLHLAFTSDGTGLISGGSIGGRLLLWHLDTASDSPEPVVLNPESSGNFALGPGDRWLAAQLGSYEAAIWDLTATNPVKSRKKLVLKGERLTPVSSLVFSPDGRLLYVGSYGGTIHVFATKSGRHRGSFGGHLSPVELAISGDGRRLLSADADMFSSENRTVRMWTLSPKGFPESWNILVGNTGSVRRAVVSQDGGRVTIVTYDNKVHVFDTSTGAIMQQARDVAGRNLTPQEWQLYRPGAEYRKTFE